MRSRAPSAAEGERAGPKQLACVPGPPGVPFRLRYGGHGDSLRVVGLPARWLRMSYLDAPMPLSVSGTESRECGFSHQRTPAHVRHKQLTKLRVRRGGVRVGIRRAGGTTTNSPNPSLVS